MAEHLAVGLASVIVLGIAAQWLAWRLKLPSILLLLLFGFLAGPITHLLDPDELLGELLFPIVSLSVGIILFEGGLSLRIRELPNIGDVVGRLISIGALVTWLGSAFVAHYLVHLDWSLSVLLGSILVVTGPTVVGPLLRQIRPHGEVGAVLKWEGILIDPVGAVLAVLVFEATLKGDLSQVPLSIIWGIIQTVVIGMVLGFLAAWIMTIFLRRYWIPDHLQNSMALLLAVASFSLSNILHEESGLLTVTIMGLVLANQKKASIKHIIEFKENLTVLLIGILFILLTSRLQLQDITNQGWRSVLFVAVLIIVIRPLSVLISTLRSRLDFRSRLFLTWLAPRGIVAASIASVFAFELDKNGHNGAEQIVPITFLVIAGTVLFYGLTAGPAARRLGLAEKDPQGILFVGGHAVARAMASALQDEGFQVVLVDTNQENITQGQLEGVMMHYGDALSESVLEECDLSGIGRLLAVTSNDEVNALAALHFPEVFGRASVYQLPLSADRKGLSATGISVHLRGRFLFDHAANYQQLMEMWEAGARVRSTQLTPQFTYADFRAHYGDTALLLFIISDRCILSICTAETQPFPQVGQTVISLTMENPDSERNQCGTSA